MKKRLIALILALTLSFALAPMAGSIGGGGTERGVARVEEFIAPQYEDTGNFVNDIAAVKKDGKWGYIDLENNVIIPFEYDYASFFAEGYAIVGKIDKAPSEQYNYETYEWENVLIDCMYIGRIDKEGNYKPLTYFGEPINFQLEYFSMTTLYYYYGGWVAIGGLIHDTDGKDFQREDGYWASYSYAPTEGIIAANYAGEGFVLLDMKGNPILSSYETYRRYDKNGKLLPEDADYDQISYVKYLSNVMPFNQGLAPAYETTVDYETWNYTYEFGFVNSRGRWVVGPWPVDGWISGYYVSDTRGAYQVFNSAAGLASVQRSGRFGAVDKNGNTVVDFKYDALWPFGSQGVAAFELNGLYGYVDTAGNEIIPAKFVAATGFYGGYAVVHDGTTAMLINTKGEKIEGSDSINLDVYYTVHEDGSVTTRSPGENVAIVVDGKYGFGKLTYEPPLPDRSEMTSWAYDEVVEAIEANLIPVSLQSQYRLAIDRADFSNLVLHAICEMLDTELEDLILERTKKSLDAHVGEYKFSDTFTRSSAAASALGLVTGYEDGTFRPYNKISRQEAAVLLWRAAGVLGLDNTKPPESSFTDRDKVANWAVTEVDYISSIGVMGGTGSNMFSPSGTYERQQAYTTVIRLLKAMLEANG